jgi:hypothetical protein
LAHSHRRRGVRSERHRGAVLGPRLRRTKPPFATNYTRASAREAALVSLPKYRFHALVIHANATAPTNTRKARTGTLGPHAFSCTGGLGVVRMSLSCASNTKIGSGVARRKGWLGARALRSASMTKGERCRARCHDFVVSRHESVVFAMANQSASERLNARRLRLTAPRAVAGMPAHTSALATARGRGAPYPLNQGENHE